MQKKRKNNIKYNRSKRNQIELENTRKYLNEDRDKHGGGIIEYVKKGIVCRLIKQLETKNSEVICSELTVKMIKWVIFSIYRPSSPTNLTRISLLNSRKFKKFLAELEHVMADIDIDLNKPNDCGFDSLAHFCDTYNLKYLIKGNTCFTTYLPLMLF